ncbi:MAG: response regulator [Lachnospiraceae bacterium]|nr:response regulator [Lachnospiraceae bacterium]
MRENGKLSVLIADDSEMESIFLSELFARMDIRPDVVTGAEDCIKMCTVKNYDVILYDLIMPGADARLIMDKIKSLPHIKDRATPVIAMGGNEELADIEAFLEAGFKNILKKPVSMPMLQAALYLYLPEDCFRLIEKDEKLLADGEDARLPEWLSDLTKLDAEEGVKNCASVEGYLSALGIFYNSIGVKADEIKKYYDDGDWKAYTIKVHALKSSARLIGAMELSELAKNLEAAGNNFDETTIKLDTDRLLSMYREYERILSPLGEDKGASSAESGAEEDMREVIPANVLEDAVKSLKEFADNYDYELVEMVLNSVKEYKLPERPKELFERIEKLLISMDWDEIRKLLQNV